MQVSEKGREEKKKDEEKERKGGVSERGKTSEWLFWGTWASALTLEIVTLSGQSRVQVTSLVQGLISR